MADFLNGLGIEQMDDAALYALLEAWAPELAASLSDADREALIAALAQHLDPDGDGQNNLFESLALTDPLSSASFFGTTFAGRTAAGFSLRWMGHVGVRYRVLSSTDFAGWVELPGSLVDGTGRSIFESASGDRERANRVDVSALVCGVCA